MIKVLVKLVLWILSVTFILFSIVSFTESFFSGLLFGLGALVINPIFISKIRLKNWVAVLTSLLLFVSGCGVYSTNINYISNDNVEVTNDNVEVAIERDLQDEYIVSELVDSDNVETDDVIQVDVLDEDEQNTTELIQEDIYQELTVHFIDVGQGDCTVLVCGDEAMMVDAGKEDMGTAIQLYLKKNGIESFKYICATHPDADHIGGLDVILYKYSCDKLLMTNRESDSLTYFNVMDTIEYIGQKITTPSVGDEYYIGDAKVIILGPINEYDDDNNSSIVIKVVHGDNTFLLTGDIERQAEMDLINSGYDIKADVLKVAHHGSDSSTNQVFLDSVSPKYAIISCGLDNSYGHPHSETINKLENIGCEIYRTDMQGSMVVISNGISLKWNID